MRGNQLIHTHTHTHTHIYSHKSSYFNKSRFAEMLRHHLQSYAQCTLDRYSISEVLYSSDKDKKREGVRESEIGMEKDIMRERERGVERGRERERERER